MSNRTARPPLGRADGPGCERTSSSINGDHFGADDNGAQSFRLYGGILMALPGLHFCLTV